MPTPSDLRARIEAIIAEHDGGSGYSRFGGDAILSDLRDALATPLPEGAAPSLDADILGNALDAHVNGDLDHCSYRCADLIAAAYLRESLPQPQDET